MQQEKDNSVPRFYKRPVQNNFRSAAEGKPVFDMKDYVEIIVPGLQRSTVDRQVQEVDKERWPDQWDRYLKNEETPAEGTPITEWAAVTAAQALELKHRNVRTVEELASVSDNALQNLGIGAMVLRDKARAWLEQAKGNAATDQLVAENRDLKAQVAALSQQVADLAAMMKKEPEDERRKAG